MSDSMGIGLTFLDIDTLLIDTPCKLQTVIVVSGHDKCSKCHATTYCCLMKVLEFLKT